MNPSIETERIPPEAPATGPEIATTAMSDYSEPAKASLIVPVGFESKYFDQAAVDADGWTYDPDKAVSILEGELKAKKGSDGIYELPDGTKLGGWTLITHSQGGGTP